MKRNLFLIVGGACLMLGAGQATAGQCSQEIAMLEKSLSSTDAGQGPTDTGMAESTASAGTATEVPQAGEVPQTEATPAMNEETAGIATSPEDVQRQNTGEPTAAEAAQAGQSIPAAGQSEVTDPLQEARMRDQAGDEAGCMESVSQAKQALGIQ